MEGEYHEIEQAAEDQTTALIRQPITGRFVKGVSGNPKGRPKRGQTYVERLKAAADRNADALVASAINEALNGRNKIRAHTYIRDTAYGIPKQTIIMQSEETELERTLRQWREQDEARRTIDAESVTLLDDGSPGEGQP